MFLLVIIYACVYSLKYTKSADFDTCFVAEIGNRKTSPEVNASLYFNVATGTNTKNRLSLHFSTNKNDTFFLFNARNFSIASNVTDTSVNATLPFLSMIFVCPSLVSIVSPFSVFALIVVRSIFVISSYLFSSM
ncbi:MAG: hypothetical protein EOM11_09415, partial [Erysipelotrichia bacterium]|nr:hypothetical protein [Erysipelotrichia bacterium]